MTSFELERYFARHFGIDEHVLEKVIGSALEKGGDFAEVFCQHKTGDFIGFEDGEVNRAFTSVDLGAGVRVLKGDQTGYAFTEDLSPEKLIVAARTASAIASSGLSATVAAFQKVELPILYPRRQIWLDVPPLEKISIARKVGEDLLARDPRVVKAQVRFTAQDDVILVANSAGTLAWDARPMTFLYAGCVAEQDGRREQNTYSRSGREGIGFYSDAVLNEIASEAVRRTTSLFGAAPPPAGEMEVVLAAGSSGILLHEAMGHGFEADFNRKEKSIFCSMMGKKVAEDFVTIVDTALEPGARGAIHVDDEGTPGERTVLVENGVLVSYLHDRLSAQYYGVPLTGNGRRENFRCAPLPRMRVTTMENGPHNPEEIIHSVKRGIYAIDFANGQVAIGAGDYSFYVKSGYLIEDGKLTQPIKDANIIGNGPDSLAKVTMVGNDKLLDSGTWTCGKDSQRVPVGLGMPTVKVSSITVGGLNR